MTGDVRKRRGKRKSAARDDDNKKENNNKAPPPKQQQPKEEEETAWQTVKNHPLVMVLPIVLIPYALYLSYLYLQLQRPDIVETATFGLLPSLRPAVTSTEKRQVLIVGTMSSGTVQVAHDLSQQLQLEVGHEVVDATWNFCRDGTVSWFHGIRFLQPLDTKDLVTKWSLLCGNNYTENMGFHPNMYTSSCSSREKWSKCWSNACLEIFQQEWGCAWNQKDGCATPPFETTLLQVRNPMHTISSLVTKFCVGGMNGTIHSSFLPFASALFPFHNFTNDSCIEAMGTFVVEYNTALLKAKDAGLVTEMYRVEETSACQVAHLAGLGEGRNDSVSTQFQQGCSHLQ